MARTRRRAAEASTEGEEGSTRVDDASQQAMNTSQQAMNVSQQAVTSATPSQSTMTSSSSGTPSSGILGQPTREAASWTKEDERMFVEWLLEHVSEAGDGGNFKISTMRKAATHLNKHLTKGGLKTGESCKEKWRKVRLSVSVVL